MQNATLEKVFIFQVRNRWIIIAVSSVSAARLPVFITQYHPLSLNFGE